jgi:uncharacterized membrane protein YagU involved in acid resistance
VRYRLKEEAKAKGIITPKVKRSRRATVDNRSKRTGSSNVMINEMLLNDKDLMINPDNIPFRWERVRILVMLIGLLILDQVVEGNNKLPSLLGIPRCSSIFWLCFISFAAFLVILAKVMYGKVRDDESKRIFIGNNEDFRIGSDKTAQNIDKILFMCFIGGVMSGMLGVGGGIILTPLMLELGVLPKVASSTANFLLVFTASSGSFLFIISNQLIWDYAIFYAFMCSVASVVGSIYISAYIKRTNRMSVLIYMLFYLMIFSLMILPINGIKHAYYDLKSGFNLFQFRSFC